ncbi:hypothetical protein [Hymenobacter glacieicola]|uniref:hypothetical protein n=1 Tax=Hymenobacter glacieicola TaxID=1562124 RepID=UPI00166A2E0C|nr:hypothetical protein [Hymenobacter glacieicola]
MLHGCPIPASTLPKPPATPFGTEALRYTSALASLTVRFITCFNDILISYLKNIF